MAFWPSFCSRTSICCTWCCSSTSRGVPLLLIFGGPKTGGLRRSVRSSHLSLRVPPLEKSGPRGPAREGHRPAPHRRGHRRVTRGPLPTTPLGGWSLPRPRCQCQVPTTHGQWPGQAARERGEKTAQFGSWVLPPNRTAQSENGRGWVTWVSPLPRFTRRSSASFTPFASLLADDPDPGFWVMSHPRPKAAPSAAAAPHTPHSNLAPRTWAGLSFLS
jgi:hypothetical protein